MTSCKFDEEQVTKPKFVAPLFATTFFNPQQMFLVRDKLITQGEKRETSTQDLKRNNVARRAEGICISYFAAFICNGSNLPDVHGLP